MKRGRLSLAVLVVALSADSCAWPSGEFSDVGDWNGNSARVWYWPAVDRCEPQDLSALLAVGEFAEKYANEALVETLLPRGLRLNDLYGQPIPGATRFTAVPLPSVLPRIQMWTPEGTLVLDRAIPPFGDQKELVLKELISALSL